MNSQPTPFNAYAYRTWSGVMVNLSCPRAEDLRLTDIAHHLARVCRYNGAVDGFYSVASHSVYVARNVAPEYAPAALLHDATEAYLGDMTSGLKRLFPTYRQLEAQWAHVIEIRFDVRFHGESRIKDADLRARLSEARDLFADHGGYPRGELLGGEGDRAPFAERVVCQTPDEGEWAFLAMAHALGLE